MRGLNPRPKSALEPGLLELNPAPLRCGVGNWGAPKSAVKVAARSQNKIGSKYADNAGLGHKPLVPLCHKRNDWPASPEVGVRESKDLFDLKLGAEAPEVGGRDYPHGVDLRPVPRGVALARRGFAHRRGVCLRRLSAACCYCAWSRCSRVVTFIGGGGLCTRGELEAVRTSRGCR